jgi:peptidoglycan/LPS O-acetylase OafA/YrhL
VTSAPTLERPRSDGVRAAPAVFPALDALRALGALAVVGTHAAFQTGRTLIGPFSAVLARLDSGVALFFVLSGFLLFRPLAAAVANGRAATPVRRYLWRRALRILPTYWLVVVAALLVLPQNRDSGIKDWVAQLSLTQVYGAGLQRHGLSQMWSLCVEVAFYLVLPLLGWLALGRRGAPWRPGRALTVVALSVPVSAGWIVAAHTLPFLDIRIHGQWLPWHLPWFAAGMAFAVVHVHTRSRKAHGRWLVLDDLAAAPGTCLALAGVTFLLATTPIAGPRSLEALPTLGQSLVKMTLYTVTAALVVLPAVFGSADAAHRRVLAWSPLRRLGDLSYGIFLCHLIVLETVVRLIHQPLFTGSWAVTFGLTVLGSTVLAGAAHALVERPVRRWRNLV